MKTLWSKRDKKDMYIQGIDVTRQVMRPLVNQSSELRHKRVLHILLRGMETQIATERSPPIILAPETWDVEIYEQLSRKLPVRSSSRLWKIRRALARTEFLTLNKVMSGFSQRLIKLMNQRVVTNTWISEFGRATIMSRKLLDWDEWLLQCFDYLVWV